MNPLTEKTLTLIRDLATGFVDYPEALRAEVQEAEGSAAYFMLRGHAEDTGKLVGTGGSHVDAMAFLVLALGVVNGWGYSFRLLTETRQPSPAETEPRHAMAYDPTHARLLLLRILEALGLEGCTVTVGPGAGERDSLTFAFTIIVADAYGYSLLTVPHEIPRPDRDISMAIIGAIGTLFRAMARKNGVRFILNVGAP